MSKWQNFENKCKEYLDSQYGKYAKFSLEGGSNANISDIAVKTKSNRKFYIEVKHCPAQCGQFVLLPDVEKRKFIYSSKNALELNENSELIAEYMNDSFDEFLSAGTTGKYIDMENGSKIFADWIIQSYQNKQAEYIITNDFIIFPIEKIGQYFDITAKYRIKRSGSGTVGKKNIKAVSEYIKQNYNINSVEMLGKKFFINSSAPMSNIRFTIGENEYMFSLRDENYYEIRRLSNTFNANVIFSVKIKNNQQGMGKQEFISVLEN